MDRWKVPDLAALALIGHPGSLTKKGTRPRFRLAGEEAALFSFLQEIDLGLQLFGTAPDIWLRQPIAAAPFNGATPFEHIARQRQDGARDTIRRIMQVGLQGADLRTSPQADPVSIGTHPEASVEQPFVGSAGHGDGCLAADVSQGSDGAS